MVKRGKHLKLVDIPRFESLVEALRKAQRRWKERKRDLALLALLIYTGCRLGEIVGLTLGDLDFTRRTVKIRQEKKRTEHVRIIPVPSALCWRIVRNYVKTLPFKSPDTPLFTITKRQARNIVYAFTERFLGRRLRPHAIRHSYAVFILKNTRNLEVVRRLLGHSSYKWLKEYLNYTQEDLQEELEDIFLKLE